MMHPWREVTLLILVAAIVRGAGLWALGQGAPFGPDGAGIEAAVVIPGHLYPLHIQGVSWVGSAQLLSLITGILTCPLLWLYGKRLGLSGVGGWLAAITPIALFTSTLSSGDAPALFLVTLGAALATYGPWASLAGGLIAGSSLLVKPIAFPAIILLVPLPWAWPGVAFSMAWNQTLLDPLLYPTPEHGLLGSWWSSSGGTMPDEWVPWLVEGGRNLLYAPLWSGAVLTFFAVGTWSMSRRFVRGSRMPQKEPLRTLLHINSVAPLLTIVGLTALFGTDTNPRYLQAPVIASLPWVGLFLAPPSRGFSRLLFAGALLWVSAALFTQVGEERTRQDPTSHPPSLPIVPLSIDTRAIFVDCSTPNATQMRNEAAQLAQTLPHGAEIAVEKRVNSGEGELIWPLKAARPDIVITLVEPNAVTPSY